MFGRRVAGVLRESVMPLHSALGENLPATLSPVLSCPHSRDLLETHQGGSGLRDPVLQGGAVKLGCLHLMKRRCRGDLIAVYNYRRRVAEVVEPNSPL